MLARCKILGCLPALCLPAGCKVFAQPCVVGGGLGCFTPPTLHAYWPATAKDIVCTKNMLRTYGCIFCTTRCGSNSPRRLYRQGSLWGLTNTYALLVRHLNDRGGSTALHCKPLSGCHTFSKRRCCMCKQSLLAATERVQGCTMIVTVW